MLGSKGIQSERMSSKTKLSKGQGLIEFALLLPVLVLILFGVLDLGRAFFAQVALANAARVGARSISFNDQMTLLQVQEATKDELRTYGLNPADVTVNVTCPDSAAIAPQCESEHPIQVEVTYPFQLTMDFLFPQTITFRRAAEMMTP